MTTVRRGGIRLPSGYQFELTGGDLALDLANTVDERPQAATELLQSWNDLIDWSEQAGAVGADEARRLRTEGHTRPGEAAAVLERARSLRERIYRIFAAVAAGDGPAAVDVAMLNDALSSAMVRRNLAASAGGASWAWRHPEGALDRMLPPVIFAAAALLTDDGRRARVRRCAADETCHWLFVDESRNRTRRWCDMTVCGNRVKARRHRALGRP